MIDIKPADDQAYLHFESLSKAIEFFKDIVDSLEKSIAPDVFWNDIVEQQRKSYEKFLGESPQIPKGAIYAMIMKVENDFVSTSKELQGADSALIICWEISEKDAK